MKPVRTLRPNGAAGWLAAVATLGTLADTAPACPSPCPRCP